MEQLGIQPMQLLMQVINILVLVFVLSRLLLKPVLKMIEDRQKRIKEGLELQAQMVEEKEKLAELKKKEVDKGRQEAKKIIQEAKEQAKEQADKIIIEAQKQSRDEKEKTANEIEDMRKQLESQIKKDAVELASAMAERVLGDVLKDKDAQHRLISKQLNALNRLSHENK